MKKKLVQINTVCNGSTGKIMKGIQKKAEEEGFETISFVGRRKPYTDLKCEKFGNGIAFWIHVIINTLFDRQGHGSYFVTRKLIHRLREESPDIIHLHNLHGYYLHIPSLIKYLKEEFNGKIFWTFHDCWPFTGHCPHFTMVKCDKWKTECYNCPNKSEYPISWGLDSSRKNYQEKKKWFCELQNLTIIVPSHWMKGLVEDSFLKDHPVKVIPNGIDLKVFYRRQSASIREKYGIPENRKILLGVASVWSSGKGLDTFNKISSLLPQEYVIVLVGVNMVQQKRLSPNIIGIARTQRGDELAELYSEAHIFVNPSVEESFSLVTMEAMACGTPAIVLDTSAVKELVTDYCGRVLHDPKPKDYINAILDMGKEPLDKDRIAKYAKEYSMERTAKSVVKMYYDIGVLL